MRILGIDPGTIVLGWGLLAEEPGPAGPDGPVPPRRHAEWGVVRASRSARPEARLATVHDGLAEVLERTRPDRAAIERAFFGRDAAGALRIGEARGVAMLACARARVPVEEITPAEVKRAVVGSGGASKAQVARMVAALLGLSSPPEPEDAADALAVALAALHRSSRPPELRSARGRTALRRNAGLRLEA